MRVEFIPDYDTSLLKAADYNPRKLDPAKAEKLKYSLKKFGIIKPLIINGKNGILTAGHQRTNAIKEIGFKTVPVIRIAGVERQDEIRFNLLHNSIETNTTPVNVNLHDDAEIGYRFVSPEDINYKTTQNAVRVQSICNMIYKYGEWGSIIVNQNGDCIFNNEYAVAAKMAKIQCLCYVIKNEDEKELREILGIDYGEYYYDTLGIKSYNQLYCQMNRLAGASQKKSSTYEGIVLPMINKSMSILDFGAGKCAYANRLKKQGYDIYVYEPNFQSKSRNIDIAEVKKQIKRIENFVNKNGLFDVVVLDSVYNSVVNSTVEKYVTIACNSFLKKDGTFITGTRSLVKLLKSMEVSRVSGSRTRRRNLEFLDKENFSATFRDGVWTLQHFHTKESLKKLLSQFFGEVTTLGSEIRSNIYAVAKKPLPLNDEDVKMALEFELNMEYPNNYHHNQHKRLVELLLKELQKRNENQ